MYADTMVQLHHVMTPQVSSTGMYAERKIERRKKERNNERKKEKRNLSKKRKRLTICNTLVKHWFPLSFYCLVLRCNPVLFPEMSASQPFRKGFGDI
jgi:hypothetical protein